MRREIGFKKSWGFALGLMQYGVEKNAHIQFCFLFGFFYIPLPFALSSKYEDFKNLGYGWGFKWHLSEYRGALFWNWGSNGGMKYSPWDWDHLREDILMADGTWKRVAKGIPWDNPSNDGKPWAWTDKLEEKHGYAYVRKNGEVQERLATIGVNEMEWRWRWFKWLPWPRQIQRCITVEFDDEVGERTGTWKGGTLGCGYEMKKGETPLETLRRMEAERKF